MQEPTLPISFDDLAHVIRTPLTVIKTQISLAKAGGKDSNKELVETINEQVDLLSNILDDISLLVSSQAGILVAGSSEVNIPEIAKSVVKDFNNLDRQNKPSVSTDMNKDVKIIADEEHIRRIINRLISHSILDGAANVNLRVTENEITVEDDGLGTSIDVAELKSNTPKYSRRASVGLHTIKTLGQLYGYTIEVATGPSGSKIKLKRP